MAVPVVMPKFEMSQETGVLIEWLKAEGDPVEKGEPIFSVETDKVTMEVESPAAGVLAGLSAAEGDSVAVTTVIGYILEPGEALPAVVEPEKSGPELGDPPMPGRSTRAGEDGGAPVPAATPVARRLAAANHLDLREVRGSGPDQTITKSDVEALIARDKTPAAPSLPASSPPQEPTPAGGKVRATPAARRIAREMAIDLAAVQGSGPRGRVQADDVARQPVPASPPELQPAVPVSPTRSWEGEEEVEVVPLQGMRKTIAERMVSSYQSAPHITFTTRVDMTHMQALRERLNEKTQETGGPKISLTALLVKAAAAALLEHPWLNSSLKGESVLLHKRVHMGVAVALPDGLIVPVVRDADSKGVARIAAEVNDLAGRAREGRLTPAEVTGSTFTITNLGPFGIEQFTAILNPGQAGILAVGAVRPEVVPIDGQAVIRPVLNMTLSADHRVVDGAVAAHFLAGLRQILEDPRLLLL